MKKLIVSLTKTSSLGRKAPFLRPRQDTNLKSAVCAMVERLDEGVRRLEMASEQSAAGGSSELELVRQARRGG